MLAKFVLIFRLIQQSVTVLLFIFFLFRIALLSWTFSITNEFHKSTNKILCESVMQKGPPYKHKRSLDMESIRCCGFFPVIKEEKTEKIKMPLKRFWIIKCLNDFFSLKWGIFLPYLEGFLNIDYYVKRKKTKQYQ